MERNLGRMCTLLCYVGLAITAGAQVHTVADFPGGASSIIQGSDGNFYGTTSSDGASVCQGFFGPTGCGTIFKVTPQGVVSTLYSFPAGPNSTAPFPNTLVQGTDGNFYGTTARGGSGGCTNGCGTLFKMTPSGSVSTLYTFDSTNGEIPVASLLQGADGNFYGITVDGGTGSCTYPFYHATGCGTVFKITPQGSLTTIYIFDVVHGASPTALIKSADGNFYGTTAAGGIADGSAVYGSVFKITPAGALTTLYSFHATTDGSAPIALIQTTDGNLYGITQDSGNGNFVDRGAIFKLTPSGTLTSVAASSSTLAYPNGLLQASDGNLYGTSSGDSGVLENGVVTQTSVGGTLFKLPSTGGQPVTLYNFCSVGCPEPNYISAYSLIQGNDGNLYGLTGSSFFRYDLVSNAPAISTSGGVLNGASFQSGISANSWITINGTNLSSKTDTWNSAIVNGALPTKLDGVSVTVGGQPAYIEYVSPTQINAIAPNVAAGSVPVVVTNANGSSPTVSAQLSAAQPAFFQWGNYAVATRLDYSLAVKNGTLAGATTAPAKPGDVVILWGTGFGPTLLTAPSGVETPSTATYYTAGTVTVTVGAANATVYGAALAPGYAGLYQIAIQVPSSLGNGDYLVVATVGGVQSASGVMITVQQ